MAKQDGDADEQHKVGVRHVLDKWVNDAAIAINKNLRIWRYSMIVVVASSLGMVVYIVQKGAANNIKSVGDNTCMRA